MVRRWYFWGRVLVGIFDRQELRLEAAAYTHMQDDLINCIG